MAGPLPYMRQLPQDYYKNNYPPTPVTPAPAPTLPTFYPDLVPGPGPTDPINEGGIWIGTIYPSNPGEGWLFWNTNDNTLHIYEDGAWQLIPTGSGTGGIADAPSDGGTYARRNAAWTNTYDGGSY